uniref:Alpha/beta hydrolase fold-3 domain-containing protein n=1 Tax=Oryza rufipogon TaxID=4529 RepID=A0A0E0QK86_ORYRU
MAASISSALLLLLNMAGALLSPRAPPPAPAALTGAGDGEDVDFFFFPFLVLYKSGRVVRFIGTDTVPASMDPATGVASKDVVIDADAGLAVRLYLPNVANLTAGKRGGGDKLPVVVFYHGGGFVTESAFSPTYHRYLNALVSKARVVAVSVEYHLAPEHRLPRAYDDAWAALRWVLENAGAGPEPWLSRHGDTARLFLVGDSAGGNIAHNVAMRAGGEGGAARRRGHPRRGSPRPLLLGEAAGAVGDGGPGDAAVAGADVGVRVRGARRLGRARVLVTVASLDTLSARGRAYVAAARASGWGGEAVLYETPGENHVYFLVEPDGEKAAKEMDAVVAFINEGEQVITASRMDA